MILVFPPGLEFFTVEKAESGLISHAEAKC